jgi:SAM-dependent methyltransferase
MALLFVPSPTPYRPHLPSFRQPLYLHLAPLWCALRTTLGSCRGRVLDIGCGLQPYRSFLDATLTEYTGLDRPGPLSTPTVEGDAENMPFPDGHFDVVFSNQVFEHLPDPALALREAVRVLRPGGRLILTVPGVWPTHEAPHDYWRFTRYGLMHLLDNVGIDYQLQALGGIWATIGQMINLTLYRNKLLREFIPLINLFAKGVDSLGSREDLVMNWLVDGTRRVEPGIGERAS